MCPKILTTYNIGTWIFKTAARIPNKDNMQRLFNFCIADCQKCLVEDNMLRAALSSH